MLKIELEQPILLIKSSDFEEEQSYNIQSLSLDQVTRGFVLNLLGALTYQFSSYVLFRKVYTYTVHTYMYLYDHVCSQCSSSSVSLSSRHMFHYSRTVTDVIAYGSIFNRPIHSLLEVDQNQFAYPIQIPHLRVEVCSPQT